MYILQVNRWKNRSIIVNKQLWGTKSNINNFNADYRSFLVKQICRTYGLDTYQTLCQSQNTRLFWVNVEENQQQVGHAIYTVRYSSYSSVYPVSIRHEHRVKGNCLLPKNTGCIFFYLYFLAHLSTKCSVSFCDPSMSGVRASVNNFFKQHLLWYRLLDFDQTSQEWSLGVPLSKLFKLFQLVA